MITDLYQGFAGQNHRGYLRQHEDGRQARGQSFDTADSAPSESEDQDEREPQSTLVQADLDAMKVMERKDRDDKIFAMESGTKIVAPTQIVAHGRLSRWADVFSARYRVSAINNQSLSPKTTLKSTSAPGTPSPQKRLLSIVSANSRIGDSPSRTTTIENQAMTRSEDSKKFMNFLARSENHNQESGSPGKQAVHPPKENYQFNKFCGPIHVR